MLPQQITTAYMKVIVMIQGVTRWDSKITVYLYRQSNILYIVHVINTNTFLWFENVTRREEERKSQR